MHGKQAERAVEASGIKRKLEEFLNEAELADPELVGFWLDDTGPAKRSVQQRNLQQLPSGHVASSGSRSVDRERQHDVALLEAASDRRCLIEAQALAEAAATAVQKWATAAADLTAAEPSSNKRERSNEASSTGV